MFKYHTVFVRAVDNPEFVYPIDNVIFIDSHPYYRQYHIFSIPDLSDLDFTVSEFVYSMSDYDIYLDGLFLDLDFPTDVILDFGGLYL